MRGMVGRCDGSGYDKQENGYKEYEVMFLLFRSTLDYYYQS